MTRRQVKRSSSELPDIAIDGRWRDAPVEVVLRGINRQAGTNLVAHESIAGNVTISASDRSVSEVVADIAKQLNAELDGEELVAKSIASDVAFLVLNAVPREEMATGLRSVTKQFDEVEIEAVGDGILVRGPADALDVIETAAGLLDVVNRGWMVDVVWMEVSRSAVSRLGVEARISGGLSVRSSGITENIAGELIAMGDGRANDVNTLISTTMHCIEGRQSTIELVDVQPVLERAVSPEGTVTNSGFRQIEAGTRLRAEVRSASNGITLELRPELSEFTGIVGELPVVHRRSFDLAITVDQGEWVLLTGLGHSRRGRGRRWPGGVIFDDEQSEYIMLVRVRG